MIRNNIGIMVTINIMRTMAEWLILTVDIISIETSRYQMTRHVYKDKKDRRRKIMMSM